MGGPSSWTGGYYYYDQLQRRGHYRGKHPAYGDYTVREVSTNDSMLKTFDEEISVTIDSDGEMLEYEAENEVVRGGIDISKEDSEMGSTPTRQFLLCRDFL